MKHTSKDLRYYAQVLEQEPDAIADVILSQALPPEVVRDIGEAFKRYRNTIVPPASLGQAEHDRMFLQKMRCGVEVARKLIAHEARWSKTEAGRSLARLVQMEKLEITHSAKLNVTKVPTEGAKGILERTGITLPNTPARPTEKPSTGFARRVGQKIAGPALAARIATAELRFPKGSQR